MLLGMTQNKGNIYDARALLEYCPCVGKRGSFCSDSEVKNPPAVQEMQSMRV